MSRIHSLRQCGLALATLLIAPTIGGCFMFEGGDNGIDSGSAGGSGGIDEAEFEGQDVRCCFHVSVGPEGSVPVCQGGTECINPAPEYTNGDDLNGDGTLSPDEVARFCSAKCGGWPGNGVAKGFQGLQLAPWATNEEAQRWQSATWLYSCSGHPGSILLDENSCMPHEPTPYNMELPSSHELVFAAADTKTKSELAVMGAIIRPAFQGAGIIGLGNCDTKGVDGGTCSLELKDLSVSLDGGVSTTDYEVSDAELVLGRSASAAVHFARCSVNACTGTFEFSTDEGNALDLHMRWQQENRRTGAQGGGVIQLSGGEEAIADMNPIVGTIRIDRKKQSGDLVLRGNGRDAIGDGAYASGSFTLHGRLSPIGGH